MSSNLLCSLPLLIIMDDLNETWDLRNQQHRKIVMKYVFSGHLLPSTARYCLNRILAKHILISSQHYSVIFQRIYTIEFIKDKHELQSVLSTISTNIEQRNSKERYHLLETLYGIVSVLTYNPLVIKHIFQHRHSLYIQLFHTMLITLHSNITDFMLQQELQSGKWSGCIGKFMTTIKYWKSKQFSLAIKYGLCKVIKSCFILSIKQSLNINMNIRYWLSGMADYIYVEYKYYAKKSDQKHFEDTLKKELGKMYIGFNNHCRYLDVTKCIKAHCGWILCDKTKQQFKAKNKCKGCRLVQYCCRNHQKKDWKYIHNQQCLRTYL